MPSCTVRASTLEFVSVAMANGQERELGLRHGPSTSEGAPTRRTSNTTLKGRTRPRSRRALRIDPMTYAHATNDLRVLPPTWPHFAFLTTLSSAQNVARNDSNPVSIKAFTRRSTRAKFGSFMQFRGFRPNCRPHKPAPVSCFHRGRKSTTGVLPLLLSGDTNSNPLGRAPIPTSVMRTSESFVDLGAVRLVTSFSCGPFGGKMLNTSAMPSWLFNILDVRKPCYSVLHRVTEFE